MRHYIAMKQDVVREVTRARRLAQSMSDPAEVARLENYAADLEREWRLNTNVASQRTF
jgi:hypothetical protein